MRDQLFSMSSNQAQVAAFKLLDRLQRMPKHEQMISLAMSFLLICKRYQQSPREMLELSERLVTDSLSKGRGDHVRALMEYLKHEL
jgi:hypothetical protein